MIWEKESRGRSHVILLRITWHDDGFRGVRVIILCEFPGIVTYMKFSRYFLWDFCCPVFCYMDREMGHYIVVVVILSGSMALEPCFSLYSNWARFSDLISRMDI